MADDQKPKTMDINDLVRELSKSSSTPATPPPMPTGRQAPAPQTTRPSFPTPPSMGSQPSQGFGGQAGPSIKPMTPPPAAGSMPAPTPPTKPEMPKPQFNAPPPAFNQPKPAPASPAPAAPLSTPGVKEYQSSIRTMGEDISKIKQGQQPMGVPVPRKVEQVIPSVPQPKTTPFAPAEPVKPPLPGPQFKIPSFGETQKAAPMAPSKPMPSFPSAPRSPSTGPSVPKEEQKPQIYVPQEGAGGGNRNMLFIGIGAAVLVAGFVYWFFVLRTPAPVVVESPTPTPTETPVPTPTPTLSSIFSGAQRQDISIKPANALAAFVSDISKITVDPGTFKIVNAIDAQTPSISYGFIDLVNKLALKVPSELLSNFGSDSAVFIYGQRESFDSKGNLQVGVAVPNKMAMVAELKSPADASLAAKNWEATLSSDLKILFSLGTANKDQPGFLDNSYRNMAIRYRNFPYSDRSIDYAIVPGSNGRSYLVVAGSRESMYAAIDKLKGF